MMLGSGSIATKHAFLTDETLVVAASKIDPTRPLGLHSPVPKVSGKRKMFLLPPQYRQCR